MIVCVCRNIAEDEIAELARQGASLESLRESIGLAARCARCEETAREIIEKNRAQALPEPRDDRGR